MNFHVRFFLWQEGHAVSLQPKSARGAVGDGLYSNFQGLYREAQARRKGIRAFQPPKHIEASPRFRYNVQVSNPQCTVHRETRGCRQTQWRCMDSIGRMPVSCGAEGGGA